MKEVNHRVVEILDGLSNPVRYQICTNLLENEKATSSQLADFLNRAQSNVSQHLRKLKDLDLISSKREGRVVFYRLKRRGLIEHIVKLRDHLSR